MTMAPPTGCTIQQELSAVMVEDYVFRTEKSK